jgi:hypothetical protein
LRPEKSPSRLLRAPFSSNAPDCTQKLHLLFTRE